MIGRIFATTIVVGIAGMMAGVAHSTFRHYYRKHADFEDLKTDTVQEVVLVTEFTEEVEQ
tara:strand:- start:916 stop:1095 length:180 start_codon:yes stop_codon:yes gene_type:complete